MASKKQPARKCLTLPPAITTCVTCPVNKNQHPGTVDDWTNPDDTITGAEKLKICEEKKSTKAETVKQQKVGKIKVAELEDQMRCKDVARDLTANHPKVSATHKPIAGLGPGANSVTSAETHRSTPASLSLTPQVEDHMTEGDNTNRSKANSVNFSEGSGDDSSGFEPDPEDDKASEKDVESSEVMDHVSEPAKTAAPKGKKTKTAARASITALCFTNTAVGTPTSSTSTSIKHKDDDKDEQRFARDATLSKKHKSAPLTVVAKPKGGLIQGWKKSKQPKQETLNDDSLAQPGSPIGENENPQVEFLDIIKLEVQEDNKHLICCFSQPLSELICKRLSQSLVKVMPKDQALTTATQAHGGAKKWMIAHLDAVMHDVFPKKIVPAVHELLLGAGINLWIPPTVEEIQGIVDKFFTAGTYGVAAKGSILGLMGYQLNDTHHNFGLEAVKCVQVFFNNYSSELSSLDQVVQFVEWFIEPDETTKMALFIWKSYEFGDNETIRKSASTLHFNDLGVHKLIISQGLFQHELIVDTLALAHYSVLPPINDPKKTARPIGALLLSIQAVECVLLMWKSGSFANDALEFSHQNYNDFKEDHIISIEERAKRGDAAKRKTVKIKHISKWLKTLNSWTDNKWEALLQNVKTAVNENMGKGKRRGGSGARSLSPIEIVEEDSDGEIPASDLPDVLADMPMDIDVDNNADLDESE